MNIIERLKAWVQENIRHLRYMPRIMNFVPLFIRLADINHGDKYNFDDLRIEDGELVWSWVFGESPAPTLDDNILHCAEGLYLTLILNEDELSYFAEKWAPRCKDGTPFTQSELDELNKLFGCVPPPNVIADTTIRAIGGKRFVWRSDEDLSPRAYVTMCKLAKDDSGELHNPVFVRCVGDQIEVS